eukprot:GHVU01012922.1.p1 GENE.GHVU01012922.1~~GHVU01012922.1.p1  ORF type:complete len:447 (-),score=57.40 GHVU01012922.1:124-1464(-)
MSNHGCQAISVDMLERGNATIMRNLNITEDSIKFFDTCGHSESEGDFMKLLGFDPSTLVTPYTQLLNASTTRFTAVVTDDSAVGHARLLANSTWAVMPRASGPYDAALQTVYVTQTALSEELYKIPCSHIKGTPHNCPVLTTELTVYGVTYLMSVVNHPGISNIGNPDLYVWCAVTFKGFCTSVYKTIAPTTTTADADVRRQFLAMGGDEANPANSPLATAWRNAVLMVAAKSKAISDRAFLCTAAGDDYTPDVTQRTPCNASAYFVGEPGSINLAIPHNTSREPETPVTHAQLKRDIAFFADSAGDTLNFMKRTFHRTTYDVLKALGDPGYMAASLGNRTNCRMVHYNSKLIVDRSCEDTGPTLSMVGIGFYIFSFLGAVSMAITWITHHYLKNLVRFKEEQASLLSGASQSGGGLGGDVRTVTTQMSEGSGGRHRAPSFDAQDY